MIKTALRIALAAAVPAMAALALSPSGADANVRKTIAAGATCQLDGDDSIGSHDPVAGLYVRAEDMPPTQTNVSAGCSITRDLPLSTDGFSDIEIRLRSYRNTTPQSVTCVVSSIRSDGTILDSESRTVTVPPHNLPTSTPITVMDFGSAIGATHSKGFALVRCSLPPDVALTSVYSSENDGVSGN